MSRLFDFFGFGHQENRPSRSSVEIVANSNPTALQLLNPASQLFSFCASLDVTSPYILLGELSRRVQGTSKTSLRIPAIQQRLACTPALMHFTEPFLLAKGTVEARSRAATIAFLAPHVHCPKLTITSSATHYKAIAALEGDARDWNSNEFARICRAAGVAGDITDVLTNAPVVTSEGDGSALLLSPVVKAIAGHPSVHQPVGIPVLDGRFRITRIQIVEPNSRQIRSTFDLLAGEACTTRLFRSGILQHAAQVRCQQDIAAESTLTAIASSLSTMNETATFAFVESGIVGQTDIPTSPSDVAHHYEGIEFSLGNPATLPCRVMWGTNLLYSPNPVWHDGIELSSVMSALAITFTCNDLCEGPLARYHEELLKAFGVTFGPHVWQRVRSWLSSEGLQESSFRGYEMQLGGKVNLTLIPNDTYQN